MSEDNGIGTATRSRKSATNAVVPQDGEVREASKPTRGKRRAELNARVVAELDTLRDTIDQLLERYRIRVVGRISELQQSIQGDDVLGQKPRPLTVKEAEAVLGLLNETGLKPKKGRGKDLERVQRLTRKLRVIRRAES
jgi:hypothetical protein